MPKTIYVSRSDGYPWKHIPVQSEVTLTEENIQLPPSLRVALIVHVGLGEKAWSKVEEYVQNIAAALTDSLEILVAVVESPEAEQVTKTIEASLERHLRKSIRIVENRGMDIGSFLWWLDVLRVRPISQQPHYLIKLHTKSNELWRQHLCKPLFESSDRVRRLINYMQKHESVGMLGSRFNLYDTLNHCKPHTVFVNQYLTELGYAPLSVFKAHPKGSLRFVGGTIFIARMEAFRYNLNAADLLYWQSQLTRGRSNDRSGPQRTHALERIFGIVVQYQGYRLLAV